MFTQLELDFASTLASALDEPKQVDIAWMCESLKQYLQGRTHQEQLQVAGEAESVSVVTKASHRPGYNFLVITLFNRNEI